MCLNNIFYFQNSAVNKKKIFIRKTIEECEQNNNKKTIVRVTNNWQKIPTFQKKKKTKQ